MFGHEQAGERSLLALILAPFLLCWRWLAAEAREEAHENAAETEDDWWNRQI